MFKLHINQLHNMVAYLFKYTVSLFSYASCAIIIFASCQSKKDIDRVKVAGYEIKKDKSNDIVIGAERIATYFPRLQSKRIACVVNHTSMVKEKHIIDTMLNFGLNVTKVFAPEHGFRGSIPDGGLVEDDVDPATNLPIISLYGKHKKPTPEDLINVDVMVFDIQDVGVRFYTYLSTLHYVMEACAENDISLIVLDRPNPNGHYIDGPVMEEGFKSFVGLHPVPVVYGMTIGEYARMINGEGWLKKGVKCSLEIVELKNYTHQSFYQLPIAPSPNLPNQLSILLYPSLCFFEGTSVSVGRGTNKQFQQIGHPYLTDLEHHFTPQKNSGSEYPPHENTKCYGFDLSKITIGSIINEKKINLSYLLDMFNRISKKEEEFFLESNHFQRLSGTDNLKQQILSGKGEKEIRISWQEQLDHFQKVRDRYLIYP